MTMMTLSSGLLVKDIVLFLLATIIVAYVCRRCIHTAGNYPPGPLRLPVLGNLFQLLYAKDLCDVLTDWKETYGDIVGLQALGTNVVVLNSLQAMDDLFSKRASIYSDRPSFTVVGELMKMGKSMPLRNPDKEWREMRKLSHTALGPVPVKQYAGMQEDMAALFVRDVIARPENFRSDLRLYSSRIILSLTYGIPVADVDEEYVEHAERTMTVIRESAMIGAYLCDIVPPMKHLPSWLPFQRRAARGKDMVDHMVSQPFKQLMQCMAAGDARQSIARSIVQEAQAFDGLTEGLRERALWTAASMYAAGAESTFATTLTFMLAMVLHPTKQEKAQEELDNVLGADVLPTVADRARLPYINALIKETMRWHPMLPLGFPRQSSKDDEYMGYFIPAGTIVVPNVWSIAFEPHTRYPPAEFHPERYLEADVEATDPASWAFGFGRRICPGKLLGENNIFITVSTLLKVFRITPREGKSIVPKFIMDLGSFPEPFECALTPRSTTINAAVNKRALMSVS